MQLLTQRKSESATLDTEICVTVQGPQIGAGNRFFADGGSLIVSKYFQYKKIVFREQELSL